MESKFLPLISQVIYNEAVASGDNDSLYELLANPLHEELYRRQDFDFLDELSEGQQLIISYDYVRTQVGQGGFIQLIQNKYIGLLPDMPAWLTKVGANEMAQVIDDVLKVYVLNRELLDKETNPQEFAKLYDELKEFEIIDQRFEKAYDDTVNNIVTYAKQHIEQFATIQ